MAKRSCVVPSCQSVLDEMKYEIAAELGLTEVANNYDFNTEFADEMGTISAPASIHWPTMSTRNVGFIGGNMTKRLIEQAEQVLGSRTSL